jgi:hypothetical protein
MLIEVPRSADFVALYLHRAMVKSSAFVVILLAVVICAASACGPLLRIKQLRVVTSPEEAPQPSVVLKFDVLNDSPSSLTDVVIRVSFVESGPDEIDEIPAKVVAGPVTIRVREALPAGYVLGYEMLFRNLVPECDCSPRVEILSARSLPD